MYFQLSKIHAISCQKSDKNNAVSSNFIEITNILNQIPFSILQGLNDYFKFEKFNQKLFKFQSKHFVIFLKLYLVHIQPFMFFNLENSHIMKLWWTIINNWSEIWKSENNLYLHERFEYINNPLMSLSFSCIQGSSKTGFVLLLLYS